MKKTILITGASSGLGKAASQFFAAKDWNVIATMRNPEKETELAADPNILVTSLDVNDIPSIEAAVKLGLEQFGQIDALVNNAGYGQQGVFEAVSPEKIMEQFNVNVFGLMNVTRAVLPHFRKRQQGTIVNISSGAGRITTPILSVYSASKFAVEGFSESLAYELESQHIKVKIVEPGYIGTSFHERAGAEFATADSLTDYADFSAAMNKLFSSFGGSNNATAEDVARIIYGAVTDNSYTLRYVIGPETEPLIQLRNSKPDQEYVNTMRGMFMPNAFENR